MPAANAHGQRDSLARLVQLTPEQALLAAIVRQLLADAQSPRAPIREEARGFLQAAAAVQWWDDALGFGGRLLREAHALVEPGAQARETP